MKADRCPVCYGKGKMPYDGSSSGSIGTMMQACHGCNGKGWVTVPEGLCCPNIPPELKNHNKCPDCGQDRHCPPSTGCRQGIHYGTYC